MLRGGLPPWVKVVSAKKMGKEETVIVTHRGHERRLDRRLGFCSGEERWRRMGGIK